MGICQIKSREADQPAGKAAHQLHKEAAVQTHNANEQRSSTAGPALFHLIFHLFFKLEELRPASHSAPSPSGRVLLRSPSPGHKALCGGE